MNLGQSRLSWTMSGGREGYEKSIYTTGEARRRDEVREARIGGSGSWVGMTAAGDSAGVCQGSLTSKAKCSASVPVRGESGGDGKIEGNDG